MRQFIFIWAFYKPYAVWSFGISVLLGFFNMTIPNILITKIFMTVFLWFFINETYSKRKLKFYINSGISTLKLFSALFLIDSLIGIPYLVIFKNFT